MPSLALLMVPGLMIWKTCDAGLRRLTPAATLRPKPV
jgi:hypothetical protein